MSLTNVWLQMFDGSLVRADQVVEIELHQTPEIAGKPSRWLLDVVLPVPVGSGGGAHEGWRTGPLHRTLTQSSVPPTEAPPALARLLARLDAADAAGIVRVDAARVQAAPHPDLTVAAGALRLGFTAFAGADTDDPVPAALTGGLDGRVPGP
ncbi:hypothetical protein [Pseudonocardia humida]|uniref:Uncharacterized protein n=1 Tax=Pseudonocardia humida TaxID=2800819 RepID=A0ABT0ZTJ4_9PSEU|nr:hypothetical protein [Pseudonocardia humida]MCO1654055.1 hypothetical protein [Pseudonocardia humida]